MLILIAGCEKSYTTSLAYFLVENDLCDYLCPGVKEPHIFSSKDNVALSVLPGRFVLDASQSYFPSPFVFGRLKNYNCRVFLSYRQPMQRAYSAWRMYRNAGKGNKNLKAFKQGAPSRFQAGRVAMNHSEVFRYMFGSDFSRIEKYFFQERHYIDEMSFLERLDYERDFFDRRGDFPFFSILINSMYSLFTRRYLENFSSFELLPLTLHSDISSQGLGDKICDFIGSSRRKFSQFPHAYKLSSGIDDCLEGFDLASRERYVNFFNDDISLLSDMYARSGCDLSFFDPELLYVK